MHTEQWTRKVSTGNNVFIIGNDVCSICNIVECFDGVYVLYRAFTKRSSFYAFPFSSDFLNVYRVSHLSDELKNATT